MLRLQICHLGPFRHADFSFSDGDPHVQAEAAGQPGAREGRQVTVIHGRGGAGKTTLMSALANTRPGSVVALSSRLGRALDPAPAGPTAFAIADWSLGQDDPERPHALRLATPGARVFADEPREGLRRREQVLFDRAAREGGFVLVTLPSARWFSRQPLGFGAVRTLGQYDVRAAQNLDDNSRADLTRETKQALAYAAITQALSREQPTSRASLTSLGEAVHEVVNGLAELSGFSYRGLDPATFEPQFYTTSGASRSFDELPAQTRHLVAIGALSMRALWAAYGGRDPRQSEGVVAVDEIELHQDPGVQASLVPRLRELLPLVQWIITTTSAAVASSVDTREVLALRRLPEREYVEVFAGSDARTH